MNYRLKNYFPVLLLIFCLLVLTIGQLIPIEFINKSLRNCYYFILIICVIITSFFCLKKISYWNSLILRVIISLVFVFLIFVSLISLMFGLAGSIMCGTSEKILFENKQESNTKIVERSYGCGATDTDFPEYKMYKLIPLANQFNFITEFDTSHIDRENWKQVND